MAKIIGLGGIFFKSINPQGLANWYKTYLGLEVFDWGGAVFMPQDYSENTYNIWAVHAHNSEKFAPSQNFMINFIIDNLDELVHSLNENGLNPSEIEVYEQGKFAWVIDPDGNKVELWEPANNKK